MKKYYIVYETNKFHYVMPIVLRTGQYNYFDMKFSVYFVLSVQKMQYIYWLWKMSDGLNIK